MLFGNPIDKIAKLGDKKNSAKIVALMQKAKDNGIIVAGLEALGKIGDEDARNCIISFITSGDKDIRLAACKACIAIGSEYMRTQAQHAMLGESDSAIKAEIQKAYTAKFG